MSPLQVGLLEQLADIHAPDGSDHSSEQQPQVVAAGGSGVRAVQMSAVLPVLGERQVDRVMQRLHQVTQVRGGAGTGSLCKVIPPNGEPALADFAM